MKNSQKLLSILYHQKKLFFVCACIKWVVTQKDLRKKEKLLLKDNLKTKLI